MFSNEVEKIIWTLNKVSKAGIKFFMSDRTNLLVFKEKDTTDKGVDSISFFTIACTSSGTPVMTKRMSLNEFILRLETMFNDIIDWKLI